MSSVSKRYQVIFSERAGEMLVQHVRFVAQVSPQAADKLRMDTRLKMIQYILIMCWTAAKSIPG